MDILGNYIQVLYVVESINRFFIKKKKSLFISVKVTIGIKRLNFFIPVGTIIDIVNLFFVVKLSLLKWTFYTNFRNGKKMI